MGSDFLFTTPGLLAGVARLVDLFGELDDYNFAPSPEIADAIAMKADWLAVGGDLSTAMDQYDTGAQPHQFELFEDQEAAAAVSG